MTNTIFGEGWVSIQFRWNPYRFVLSTLTLFLVFFHAGYIEFSCSFQSLKDLAATATETRGFFSLEGKEISQGMILSTTPAIKSHNKVLILIIL